MFPRSGGVHLCEGEGRERRGSFLESFQPNQPHRHGEKFLVLDSLHNGSQELQSLRKTGGYSPDREEPEELLISGTALTGRREEGCWGKARD